MSDHFQPGAYASLAEKIASELDVPAGSNSVLAKAIRLGRENVSKDAMLLRSMFEERSPVQDIIESFNDWILIDLPRSISTPYVEYRFYDPLINRTRLYHISCEIVDRISPQLPREVPNSIGTNQIAPVMTPALAKLWKIPYVITIKCRFVRKYRILHADEDIWKEKQLIQYNFDDQWIYEPEATAAQTFQFQLPCMVGSKWCNTINPSTGKRLPADILMRMGQDPEYPGATIILNGLEYNFPYTDKPQQYKNFVLPPKDKSGNNNPFVKQTVDTEIATSQNQIIMDKFNIFRFQSNFFQKSENVNIVNSVNILHLITMLFRFTPFSIPASSAGTPVNPYEKAGPVTMGLLSYIYNFDQVGVFSGNTGRLPEDTPEYRRGVIDAFKFILRNLATKEEYAQIMLIFTDTITDFESNRYSTVEGKILQWVNMSTSTVAEQRERLTNICINGIFPSIERTELDEKLWMLGTMTVKLVKVIAGFDKVTSRDHWSNKCLVNAGIECHNVFRRLWNTDFAKLRKVIIDSNNAGNKIEHINLINGIKVNASKIYKNFVGILMGKKTKDLSSKKPVNLIELLDIGNPIRVITILSKIKSNIDTNSKNLRFRAVQSDQPAYVCPYTTPDDKHCGIIKFKAITAIVTRKFDFENISLPYLVQMGLIIPSKQIASRPPEMTTPVLINGTFRGWCDGKTLYDKLAELRRNHRQSHNRISPFTSFYMSSSGFFEIYSTAGRLVRPVLVIDSATNKIKFEVDGHQDWSFSRLFNEGYIVYIGPDEADYRTIAARPERLDQWLNDLNRAVEDVTRISQNLEEMSQDPNVDPEIVQKNQTALQYRMATEARLRRNPYHYCALHPLSIFAASAAIAPFSNHNAAVRVSFTSKLTKQALSLPLINQHHAEMSLPFVTQPIVDTALSRELQRYPAGRTVHLAVLSRYTNQEDAVTVSRSFAQRWPWMQTRHYQAIIDVKGGDITRNFQKPTHIKPEEASNYFALTRDGFPAIGAYLRENDYVIGMVDTYKGRSIDKSISLGIGESGWVHDVIYKELDSKKKLSVILTEIKQLTLGAKITSRYSQKVTIGQIVEDEDMPYFDRGPNAGTSVDMLVNPHSFPSRMTIGKMLEAITGKAAQISGEIYDGTSYEYINKDNLIEELEKAGFHRHGSERMRDGTTGELMDCWVYTGPIYYNQLPHIAEEKIQARGGHGRIDVFTHQALGGRSNEGGVRFGEMEKDSTQAYQAKKFMEERMFKYSDPFSVVACQSCGTISQFVYSEKQHKCFMGSCPKTKGFVNLEIPYSFVLMQRMLMSVGILVQLDVQTLEEHANKLEFEKSRQFDAEETYMEFGDELDFSGDSNIGEITFA